MNSRRIHLQKSSIEPCDDKKNIGDIVSFPHALPYRSISEHYTSRFKGRAFKIPLTVAEDCPNRRGLQNMKVCIFCDEWGSSAKSESLKMSLKEQIDKYKNGVSHRYKVHTFLAYFQSYTSTFQSLNLLKQHVEMALSYPDIKGFIFGTRPDTLSKGVLDWLKSFRSTYVSIELGVQSFSDPHLSFMQRGHTSQQSEEAIKKILDSGVEHLGIHLIFGSPGETSEDICNAAHKCNQLGVHSVKLHHLHVLRNTPLESLYNDGKFKPLDFEEYANHVALFLENLHPRIYIHRLSAYAPRWDELISPEWTKDKKKTHQKIIDYLKSHHTYQGKKL